jgi:YD repeat-containing protein
MANPQKGVVKNTYDSSSRVNSQVDAAGLKTTWAYSGNALSPSGGDTTITDEHGNVTVEHYANLELTSITRGRGTSAAATTTFTYDPATLGRTSITDAEGHSTKNTYDSSGNLLTTTDALDNTTSYGYNNSTSS